LENNFKILRKSQGEKIRGEDGEKGWNISQIDWVAIGKTIREIGGNGENAIVCKMMCEGR